MIGMKYRNSKKFAYICTMLVLFIIAGLLCYKVKTHIQIDRENSRLIVQKDRCGYTYAVYKDHVELLEYHGEENEVYIPLTLMGKPVTTIGPKCFNGADITSVHLTSNITEIGEHAFNVCKLEYVTGDAELYEIPKRAFGGCSNLKSVQIGNKIETIEYGAFQDCKALDYIGEQPNLKYIGECAFDTAGLLRDFEVPGETEIGNLAFINSEWLKSKKDEFVIVGRGNLLAYHGTDEIVSIPQGVTVIGAEAFSYADSVENIREIYLPETVEEIESTAFTSIYNSHCTDFTVYIPESVVAIDQYFDENESKKNGLAYSNKDIKIVTTKGSVAEQYAKKYKLKCEIVDQIEYPE